MTDEENARERIGKPERRMVEITKMIKVTLCRLKSVIESGRDVVYYFWSVINSFSRFRSLGSAARTAKRSVSD